MVWFLKKLARDSKGQGLVEYGILVAGVALVSLVSVSVLGQKTTGLLGTVASILPGTAPADAGAVSAGSLIETTPDAGSGITLNPAPAADTADSDRLDTNTGIGTAPTQSILVIDPDTAS